MNNLPFSLNLHLHFHTNALFGQSNNVSKLNIHKELDLSSLGLNLESFAKVDIKYVQFSSNFSAILHRNKDPQPRAFRIFVYLLGS